MLANLRCGEIKNEALDGFKKDISVYNMKVGKSIIPNFAEEIELHITKAINKYDEKASAYYEDVYKNIRLELISLVIDMLKDYYHGQMRSIMNFCNGKFKEMMDKAIPKTLPMNNFKTEIDTIIREIFFCFDDYSSQTFIEITG